MISLYVKIVRLLTISFFFSVSASGKMTAKILARSEHEKTQYPHPPRRNPPEKPQKEGGDRGFPLMLSHPSKSQMIFGANLIRFSPCLGGKRRVTGKRRIQKGRCKTLTVSGIPFSRTRTNCR